MYGGETTAATESLELALRYDPALEALHVFDLSLCYYLGHRHEDALHTALRGLARYPEFPALYAAAAAAAARLGRSGEASRHAADLRRRLAFVTADDFGTRFRDPEQQAYLREGLVGAGL